MLRLLRNIHWHNYKPVAVEHYDSPAVDKRVTPAKIIEGDSGNTVLVKPETRILRRCDLDGCGELKTEVIDGHWTIEQVRSATDNQITKTMDKLRREVEKEDES